MTCEIKRVKWFTESSPIKVVHSLKMSEIGCGQNFWYFKSALRMCVSQKVVDPPRLGQDVLPRRQIVYWAIGFMKPLPVSDADRKGDWDWHWTHRQGNVRPVPLHAYLPTCTLAWVCWWTESFRSHTLCIALVLSRSTVLPPEQPLTTCTPKGGANQGACGGERGNPPTAAAAHLQW